ncbi:thymidylate kinase [Microbacterium phage Zenitsu]|uniref:Thymidylate kinase n=1 Tax=Microbacterium phage MCubed TaxID=2593339 RepID=A0A514U492_9CAUD|nr:thymidylate kinase [Microbacterium phage MCubed]WNN93846.1 thymidylate kinase [Microbacterium phage Zenitsu]
MFIAFEGPDKTGKSTSAANLAGNGEAIYNTTKDKHEVMQKDHLEAPEIPITYDRIDWLTHMVYRLAMPGHEWNDARVRTVFAMPDTHLVFKIHTSASLITDELYNMGDLVRVNAGYYYASGMLAQINHEQDYNLFKSITVMEVDHNQETGEFSQRLAIFDAPGFPWGTQYEKLVHDDESLLDLLRYADQHLG